MRLSFVRRSEIKDFANYHKYYIINLQEKFMDLHEAQKILKENGFIVEGWKDDRAEWEKVKTKKV